MQIERPHATEYLTATRALRANARAFRLASRDCGAGRRARRCYWCGGLRKVERDLCSHAPILLDDRANRYVLTIASLL